MTDRPRFTINRHLVMLVHKQPFLDWLLSADPDPLPKMTLDDLREDNEAFLIPDDVADGIDEAVKWVEKHWRMFFEHVLNDWLSDETLWPKALSLKLFREWFSVEYQSMVWDLGISEIKVEDWSEGDGDDEEEEGQTYH